MAEEKQEQVRWDRCMGCGALVPPGSLSAAGLCSQCSALRVRECIEQLRNKRGPYYYRWLAGLKAFLDRQTNGEC